MARDIYGEAAGARAGGRGNYLRAGRYTLLVDRIRELDTTDKPKGSLSVIAEFVVLTSASLGLNEISEDGLRVTDKPVTPNPPGSSVSVVINFTKFPEMAPQNFKGMVLGILEGRGATEDKITRGVLAGATSDKNPLRGHIVQCETVRTQSKESRKWGDFPSWRGVAQSKAQVEAACAKLAARGATDQKEQPKDQPKPSQPQQAKQMDKAPDNLEIPDEPTETKAAPAPADDGGNFLDMLD